MAENKHPKEVQTQGDKSAQAGHTINQPQQAPRAGGMAEDARRDLAAEDPDAPYGDPGTKPEDLPIASDPNPEVDPYVSRDAAQPIGTGREDQAIVERKAAEDAGLSPELEDKENRRIHGAHHERHGGRPLESFSPAVAPNDPHRPADNIAGLNQHTSNYTNREPNDE